MHMIHDQNKLPEIFCCYGRMLPLTLELRHLLREILVVFMCVKESRGVRWIVLHTIRSQACDSAIEVEGSEFSAVGFARFITRTRDVKPGDYKVT